MKHTLHVIAFSILLLSCSKNDDTTPIFEDTLVNYKISSISDLGEFEYYDGTLVKIGNDSLLYNPRGDLIRILRLNDQIESTVKLEYSLILDRSITETTIFVDTLTDLNSSTSNPGLILPTSIPIETYVHNEEYILESVEQLNFIPSVQEFSFERIEFTYNECNNIVELIFDRINDSQGSEHFGQVVSTITSFNNYDENNNLTRLLKRSDFQFIPSLKTFLFSENNSEAISQNVINVDRRLLGQGELDTDYEFNEFGYPTTLKEFYIGFTGENATTSSTVEISYID